MPLGQNMGSVGNMDVHVDAGKLNRWITIQKPVDTPDGAGGDVRVWVPFLNLWAQVEALMGSEPFFADQMYPKLQVAFTIRYRKGVMAAQRVLYGTRLFNIRSVVETEDSRVYIKLHTEELQAKGTIL